MSLLLLLSGPTRLFAQTAHLFLPETNAPITLTLTHDKEFPEDYRSIIVRSPGSITRITAHDPIHRIPATPKERREFLWTADTSGLKLDTSRFFMIGQYLADGKPHTLLFFFSQGYASDAAPLLIVGFSTTGRPFKAFEREYELKSFKQTLDSALIIGKETVPQAMCDPADPRAPSSTTYDPYSIFLLRPGLKPQYLLDASRAYNRKHYVWAGPRVREDYAVVFNLPGHPRVFAVPAKQLDHLFAGVNCTP